jgi:hypothetical protein
MNLPCDPATVWNSRRQEIFPSYENYFFPKYRRWLLHLKTVIGRGKSGKHESVSGCFVLRSNSWIPQAPERDHPRATSPFRFAFSGKLTHRSPGVLGAIYEPRDADADSVERYHGSRK